MQCTQKPPANKRRFYTSPRVLCILGFVFAYLVGLATFAPQASAAALSAPGGNVSDPVVRQIDIARPAVVRIITTINGQLLVHFTSTVAVNFPVSGGSYPIQLSGSAAFVSAHGELLTADHVVNPPHSSDLDSVLYTYAAQDVADYINAHFQVSAPYSASDAFSALSSGSLPSTASYGQPTSQIYLSTSYAGAINATKLETVGVNEHATVDRIEAQSSFNANDVAIIHVSGMDNMPSIQLGDSSQVAEQDNLTIIGYPGLGDLSQAPTDLLTSSINKIYVSALKTTDGGSQVIQVGGNVEHGDSGGPALDANGNIVGIVSFGYSGVNGDYGATSFLQGSNSATALIKSQGVNTTPGTFENLWAQAIDDYASSGSGHWQKAAQELQNLAHSYPNFLGITPYLTYAQNQANHEQSGSSSSGFGASTLLIVALIAVLLIALIVGFYLIFRRNTRTVVVAPGVPQYPSGAYGIYPQQSGVYPQQSGVYPPVPAGYGVPYAQPVQETASGVQQPVPSGVYPGYTSPAAYGAQPGQIPQTPQPVVGATPLPKSVPAAGQNGAFSLPPVQTPQPVEFGRASRPLPNWTPPAQTLDPAPGAQSSQERTVSPEPESGTLSDVLGKSATYPLSADQAETLGARTLDVAPGETRLPASAAWPALKAESETGSPQEEKAVSGQLPVRSFSVPRRPSSSEAVALETPEASASNSYTWVAPCGHTNAPDVRFCRVCGLPVAPAAPESGRSDVL